MKEFRVYADDWRGVRYAYVLVRVFDTRSEMCDNIDDCCFGPSGDAHGQCSGIKHYDKSGRLTGRFAIMWLNKEDLSSNPAELVSHECVHAAMRHMSNRCVSVQDGGTDGGSCGANEEALAYTVGCLTRQVNDKLHKLGGYEE